MNRNVKAVFAAATLYLVAISSVSVIASQRNVTHVNPFAYYSTSTTAETSTEVTTDISTEEVSTEETSAYVTENTTAESETATKIVEPVTQITTVSSFTLPNTDANGVPYTGKVLDAYNIAAKTFKDKWTKITAPVITEKDEYSDETYSIKSKTFDFDGSSYTIKRYNFNKTVENEGKITRLYQGIHIPGNNIEIRYYDIENNKWFMSSNIQNTTKQTLFIDTDQMHVILSVPGVYSKKFENSTLEYRPEYEDKVNIEKVDDGYSLNFSFPIDENVIGEYWILQSAEPLANWNDSTHFDTMKQDLALNRRFSWDGYYFPTPSSYTPYSETMLYRQPSDYAGSSFARYGAFPAAFGLGYVFVYTCMQNQNDKGYWPTGPKSGWLATDFSIGANFYDTRFNTDFAESLLYAYKRYNNDEFLFAATKYCEYFIEHALTKSYKTKNDGLLVQDYGYDFNHKDTHVSLNHQLAELNYLYTIYKVTNEEKYKNMADRMLKGIEDTQDQWVLEDNNLNYALYYTADTNQMVDYPYLTYNDLLNTKVLYKEIYGKENATIEYLLKCKKQWMDANSIVGYNTLEG